MIKFRDPTGEYKAKLEELAARLELSVSDAIRHLIDNAVATKQVESVATKPIKVQSVATTNPVVMTAPQPVATAQLEPVANPPGWKGKAPNHIKMKMNRDIRARVGYSD